MEIDTPTTPVTSTVPIGDNDPPNSEEPANKRRRKKSIVWEHFTIETVGAGCMRALCKQCKKSFAYITGSKLAGTSHLKRHIALGICPVSRQNNAASPFTPGAKADPPKRRYRVSPGFASIPFDQDRCSHEIAKMIIQHDYPLHIVEHGTFIDFVRTLQPLYTMVSFNTIQEECVAIYLREKQSLLNLISGIPGGVSLTLDLGTSNLNLGYAFLTGHFIDDDWNLRRRILSVVMLPFPDSDYALNEAVVACLCDWQLGNKLFTLTVDQSFSNEATRGNLRGLLSVKNPLILGSQLLKGSCYARVLSRLAQDALGALGQPVKRIRESVKYVKTSEAHDEKFAELRQQLQVPSTKELVIDDQTKWNTTYQMLVAACELKEVFACLDTADPVYKINPSADDWKQAEVLCTYLKLFFDAASFLTAPVHPPANAFYHEVSKIQLELTHAAMSQDPFVSELTKPLKEKFDQYWKECFLVLAIAVVMDPRFKMKLVEFSFPRIFGEDAGMWIKIVDDGIHELFLEYLAPNFALPAMYAEEGHMGDPPSEISHEVQLVPVLDGPSQLLTQDIHSEELALQELPTQEATVHEMQSHVVLTREVPAEETYHHEVSPRGLQLPQDVVSQERLDQAVLPQEKQNEEVIQTKKLVSEEGQTLEVALEEVQNSEVPSKKVQNSEVSPEEVRNSEVPSEEIQNSEVPPEEVQNSEVSPEEVQNQEAAPEEVQNQEAAPEEVRTKEVGPEEVQTQEVAPEEVRTQEVGPEEVQMQEVSPEEVQNQEAVPEEIQTQEVVLEEIQSQGAVPEEIQTQGVVPEEIQGQEVDPEEIQTQVIVPEEIQTQVVVPEEIQTQEVVREEIQTQEIVPEVIQTQEVPLQEMETQEVPPQDMQTQEVLPQDSKERPSQEMEVEEGLPQQMDAGEVLPQEMPTQEELSQGLQTEEGSQEMQTQEVPEEIQTQLMEVQEVPAQEMHAEGQLSQYVQTGEMPPQEMHDEGVLFQDVHMGDAQDMQTQEVQSQGIYSHVLSPETKHQLDSEGLVLLSTGDGLSDFEVYISEITNSQHMKLELDQYLEESLMPREKEFDVLGWWKLNRVKYPTLSKMAADILSIPVSTVLPDSVFDTENRKIDNYRSSLRPVTLEALVCAKDWLRYGSSSSPSSLSALENSKAIVKMEY